MKKFDRYLKKPVTNWNSTKITDSHKNENNFYLINARTLGNHPWKYVCVYKVVNRICNYIKFVVNTSFYKNPATVRDLSSGIFFSLRTPVCLDWRLLTHISYHLEDCLSTSSLDVLVVLTIWIKWYHQSRYGLFTGHWDISVPA